MPKAKVPNTGMNRSHIASPPRLQRVPSTCAVPSPLTCAFGGAVVSCIVPCPARIRRILKWDKEVLNTWKGELHYVDSAPHSRLVRTGAGDSDRGCGRRRMARGQRPADGDLP